MAEVGIWFYCLFNLRGTQLYIKTHKPPTPRGLRECFCQSILTNRQKEVVLPAAHASLVRARVTQYAAERL